MSNVEMAKMLTPAFASAPEILLKIPVRAKSSGPCTMHAVHGPSRCSVAGTSKEHVTIDNSSAVRVIEQKVEWLAHSGMAEKGVSRTTASEFRDV